jgi:GDP-4-dehydro-6-deoxy-D-mannose reductase
MRAVLRALITGYSGFAGGHLADHLLAETDWELWGTVYGTPGHIPRRSPRVHEREDDLRDPGSVARLVIDSRPDFVFHLAGQASVRDSWSDPWPTFETNVRMQLNLHQALAEHAVGARMIVIASNEIYGASDVMPTSESAPLSPRNPYAASKVAQDALAEVYGRMPGGNVVRLRPFTHIGPGQDDRFVTASFARQIAEIEVGLREPVIRVGNLEAERDFTDVRDMVRGYHLAAVSGATGEAYNLGSGRSHAIRDILDHFVARATRPVTVNQDPDRMRPSDVPRTLCDASKAHRELGWRAEIPFEKTLDDTLDWWRERVTASRLAGVPSEDAGSGAAAEPPSVPGT